MAAATSSIDIIINATAQGVTRTINRVRDSVDAFHDSVARSGGILGTFAAEYLSFAAAAGGALFSVREAVNFEAAMADVAKVVNASDSEIKQLGGTISEMTRKIPRSAEELAEIAAAAGQLGVKKEDIAGFVENVAKMSTAFGMSAEEAGEAVGKIANIYHLSGENLEGFGDTINTLGNNMAAKEPEIIDAMMRIGSTADQFGLATHEAASLSAALIALGKPPEVAGTAINAMLTKLATAGEQGKGFQEALAGMGISAEDLAAKIQEDAGGALLGFLGTLETLDSSEKAKVLTKLFGTEFQDDVGALVGSLGEYRKALGLTKDSTAIAGSMTKEFEARLETTKEQFALLKNAVSEVARNFGAVFLPAIKAGIARLTEMLHAVADFQEKFPKLSAGIAAVIGGLMMFKVAIVPLQGLNAAFTALAGRSLLTTLRQLQNVSGQMGILRASVLTLRGALVTLGS